MKWEEAIKLAADPAWKGKMVVLAHQGKTDKDWCYHVMRANSVEVKSWRFWRDQKNSQWLDAR